MIANINNNHHAATNKRVPSLAAAKGVPSLAAEKHTPRPAPPLTPILPRPGGAVMPTCHMRPHHPAPPARIALLGCGTVGREVASQLLNRAADLELTAILVRDTAKPRTLPSALFTTNFNDILETRPDLIIELIGGLDPAATFAMRTLSAGIPLITANKTLIAHCGPELQRIAQRCNTHLAFEAAVCAGVPILAALQQLKGDRILSLRAVVNGTCNFILTEMERGLTFADALARAQHLGYAEADPSADISGRDSAEKLTILARAAGWAQHRDIRPEHIETRGIQDITPEDIADARASRRAIRLIAQLDASTRQLRVSPALVPHDSPLARASGPDNAIIINTELAGQIVLTGAGAGPRPTTSALLSDISQLLHQTPPPPTRPGSPAEAPSPHYIRIAGQPADPDPVFQTFASHRIAPAQLTFTRKRIAAFINAPAPAAHTCAAALAALRGTPLVMPLID